ncbi:hypothetical protein IEO21_02544 [Rhodonia placenta]|uniref:Checkpoint protein n=1 Tax=Rhodonia placenta TaxID=104341 RepID=A0A8H7P7B8_9APHY|nr:hypothetical protein IEO21_02544 [Postia placenta]
MRFKATVDNVNIFYRIAQAMEKLQKRCIIRFGEEEMHIICNNGVSDGSIQVWSQIKVPSLFSNYRIQSNAGNQITLALSTEALLAALRSAATPAGASAPLAADAEVILRLAKKDDQAVLSVHISGTTRMGRAVLVSHDVRIEVLKPQDAGRLREPMCPEPEVHILLPPLAKLRTVVERLRPLADEVVAIYANNAGSVKICAQTESARVDVMWKGLQNPGKSASDPEDEPHDPEQMHGVLVSLKSLQKFLSSHVVSTTTIACICKGHCIILYVYIGEVADSGGVLTFYIPAIIDAI